MTQSQGRAQPSISSIPMNILRQGPRKGSAVRAAREAAAQDDTPVFRTTRRSERALFRLRNALMS